jgi:hypothetical protein
MASMWWLFDWSGTLVARTGLMCISTPVDDEVIDLVLE